MWLWSMKTIAEQWKIAFRLSEVLYWKYFIFEYKEEANLE